MSDDNSEQDKQYEPSQKKLDDARKKGEVPKSADLITAAGYLGLMVALLAIGGSSLLTAGTAMSVMLDQASNLSSDLFGLTGAPFMGAAMVAIGGAFLPWAFVPLIFALLSAIIQRGLVFAPSKLAPKLSRISIIKGFGNKFGRSGLFEFFKSFAKLTIYSVVLGIFLYLQLPRILGTMLLPPSLITVELARLCLILFAIVIVIAFALGMLDFLFQRAEHLRKHRMSRKEMTDEQKQSEGDPMMKQMRRQKAVILAMNQMLSDVPKADVVIVNPSHYAVALKWDRGSGRAPTLLAKGVDEIAARIREAAMEAGVPIHSDPPAARAVYATVELGEQILPDHYKAVAAAIRFAENLRKRAKPR